MANSHHFNEIFFENVRVPEGQPGRRRKQGWYYVAVALDFEKVPHTGRRHPETPSWMRSPRTLGRSGSRRPALNDDDAIRNRLAEAAIDIEIGRWMAYRVAWMQGQGIVPNAEASMCKIILTESAQRLANTIMWVLGLHGQLGVGSAWEVFKGRFQREYLLSRSQTIAGGNLGDSGGES